MYGCFNCFGLWCYRTNVCVTGVVSLKPGCYKADLFGYGSWCRELASVYHPAFLLDGISILVF